MRTIKNSELSESDIPGPDATWEAISHFALTIDGYEEAGSSAACAALANFGKPETLLEYRICLFFEQRRWRHFCETPNDEALTYIRTLVESIRQKLLAGDIGQLSLNFGATE